MKNFLNYCLFLLLPLVLWSCDDGKQIYTRLRVDSEYFDVIKSGYETASVESNPEVSQTPFGSIMRYNGDLTIYRLKKDTEFTIYIDDDWGERQPSNLFIIDSKVVDESVDVPWNSEYILPDGLSIVESKDITEVKYDMSVSEYQAFLREVCPPKVQARSMFMWVGIGMLVAFVFCCGALFFKKDSDDETSEVKEGWRKNKKIVRLIYATVMLIFIIGVPVSNYLYFYLNPNESLWFITDWGFLGFLAGSFFLFTILITAIAPLFMIGECFRKIFSCDWMKGLLMLLVVSGLCVASYFFLKMVFIQIWDQCGFIMKTFGVLCILFMAPTGLASGISSSGNNSAPDMVSDGNGNNHYVSDSQGSDTVITTDGRTMRRHSDGNYRDVH